MSNRPWYQDGLRFECTQCGNCCTGAPGYVWVSEQEIARLARAKSLTVKEFERRYVRQVHSRKSLREFSNGDCVFFDNVTRKCTVYSDRPLQCRTWPFWDSNLESKSTWRRTCEICPGSGQGRLYQIDEIEAQRSAMPL